jgi:class 3 adenylate cyclase
MMNESEYFQCLLNLKTFETFWAYFCLSDGKLYSAECRQAAGSLCQSLTQLSEMDHSFLDPATLKIPSSTDLCEINDLLITWHEHSDQEIINRLLEKPKYMLTYILTIKRLLYDRLGIPIPVSGPDGREIMYRESFIRWQAHFPTLFLMKMSKAEQILDKARESHTIVVMGDIRRSQDLMTYAKDSHSFISYMVRFIDNTRRLIDDHLGIFDKFTGDGFLAYFNEALCAMQGRDYRTCFLDFVREETAFAAEHFAAWCRIVRKLPEIPVGLSVGADLGRVFFKDISSYFMAVGDAIVWAKRMTDVGGAGETVVNNLLYEELKDMPNVSFEPRPSCTKSGEAFLARSMKLE